MMPREQTVASLLALAFVGCVTGGGRPSFDPVEPVLVVEVPIIDIAERGGECLFDLRSDARVQGLERPVKARWCTTAFPQEPLPAGWFLILGRLELELPDGLLVLDVRSLESSVDLTMRQARRRVVLWTGEADSSRSTGAHSGRRAKLVGGGQVEFESNTRLISDILFKVDARDSSP
jgi:hypothetical protein